MENLVNSSPLILVLVFLVIGFAFLMKGADFFVEGSSSIAKRLKVPPIIIGLTIVAMGTSLPETAVSVTASLVNNNELAVSNVVGSNIFNLMVVVGVCSILTPILVQKETIRRDIPFSMICALLLLGLGILAAGDTIGMRLGHLDGMILLGFFAGYIVAMIQSAMKARAAGKNVDMEGMEELEGEIGILSWPKSILFIVGGALAIAFGGDLTVDAASRIAIDLGMSQTLVGLTIVSIGTSLPELVTSVVAARKNEVDMAVGNAVGSNIFNILMVLGAASAINPVALIRENIIDIVILIVFSLIVWIYAATKQRISRKEGISMQGILSGDSCCGHAVGPTWTIVSYRVYTNAKFIRKAPTVSISGYSWSFSVIMLICTQKRKLFLKILLNRSSDAGSYHHCPSSDISGRQKEWRYR